MLVLFSCCAIAVQSVLMTMGAHALLNEPGWQCWGLSVAVTVMFWWLNLSLAKALEKKL